MASRTVAADRFVRPAWVNGRVLLGMLLFCSALILGQRALEAGRATVEVWAATRPLAANEIITGDDLAPVSVQLPEDVISLYVRSLGELEGTRVTRPVAAGELISKRWIVGDALSGGTAEMTLPASVEHAVGGALQIGDVVDVYATFGASTSDPRTLLVARGVEVANILQSGGVVMSDPALIGVTVQVPQEIAGDLAFAARVGELDLVRASPGAPSDGKREVRLEDLLP